MALRLYNSKTKAFATFTPAEMDLPFDQVLLLNILIEMKAQTHFLSVISHASLDGIRAGQNFEDTANILADIVAVT